MLVAKKQGAAWGGSAQIAKIEPQFEPKFESLFEPKVGKKNDFMLVLKKKITPKFEPRFESLFEPKVGKKKAILCFS